MMSLCLSKVYDGTTCNSVDSVRQLTLLQWWTVRDRILTLYLNG